MAQGQQSRAPAHAVDERNLHRKMMRRILPFLFVCYVVSYLDRVNVGFAALTMNAHIGLTATSFGIGAGLFFLGYFLAEIPSNLIMMRVGARLWIARIMITWGLVSAATAFVTGPIQFGIARFLLGLGEAGFVPGVFLYLSFWFPSAVRARATSLFLLGIPVANIVGSPISGALLNVTGLGLAGWQWLFILEGLPAVFLAVAVLWFLPDGPRDAAWLPAAERDWLERQLRAEAARNTRRGQPAKPPLWDILRDRRLALFAAIYFGSTASSYGLSFWTPQIVKSFGLGNVETGLLNSIPYGFASLAMVLWGRHSDRTAERRWHLALSFLILALGLAGGTVLSGLGPVVAALTIAAMGVYMLKGPFWALATEQMPPATAAASIAL